MNHYQSFSTLLAPCSPPEATLLSVRTKDRDLWEGPTLEVCDSQTCHDPAHAQVIRLVEDTKQILCTCSENRTFPEVTLCGAD